MPFFDISGADDLTGEQRVKQSANVCSKIVLDEFRIKFCVVGYLDRPWCFQQSPERRESFVFRRFTICECIEVDDGNTVGGGKLNETQTGSVGIEISGFGV